MEAERFKNTNSFSPGSGHLDFNKPKRKISRSPSWGQGGCQVKRKCKWCMNICLILNGKKEPCASNHLAKGEGTLQRVLMKLWLLWGGTSVVSSFHVSLSALKNPSLGNCSWMVLLEGHLRVLRPEITFFILAMFCLLSSRGRCHIWLRFCPSCIFQDCELDTLQHPFQVLRTIYQPWLEWVVKYSGRWLAAQLYY